MKTKTHESAEVPMSAMIDVVFLLLIFFIVTATTVIDEAHVAVNLPSPSGPPAEPKLTLDLYILPNSVYMNNRKINDAQLEERLNNLISGTPDISVNVKVDGNTKQERLVEVLDICKKSKATKLNILGLKDLKKK